MIVGNVGDKYCYVRGVWDLLQLVENGLVVGKWIIVKWIGE